MSRSPRDENIEATPDKYGRNFERATLGDVDLQLTVPNGLIPEDMVAHWFSDHIVGRIQQKIAEWWVPVKDASGVNIVRQSGSGHLHLMMIEKELHKKDDELRMQRYRDSIGENHSADLKVEGLETTRPYGDNKIKVSKDAFAS